MAVATRSVDEATLIGRHHPVGVSTGYMTDMRGDWSALVQEAAAISEFAVELSALSEQELGPLATFLAQHRSLPFRYLSIHGPSKGREIDEEELVCQLSRIVERADGVVMHPDTIESPHCFRKLGRKLILENMDSRKHWGRTGEELAAAFETMPDAGFCFDVAHAWSIDPSMGVAHDLLDEFGDRLRQVHVSSLSPSLHHVSLTEADETLFRPVLERCIDVPWILEARPR